jgi:hypothetical protein
MKNLFKNVFTSGLLLVVFVLMLGLSSTAVQAQWYKENASGIRDVSIASDGKAWLVGQNGTVWFGFWQTSSYRFTQVPASDFSRIAVAPNNVVWAVGFNGTVWKYASGVWTMVPIDVGTDGLNGMVGVDVDYNGTIWFVRSSSCAPIYISCSASTKGSIWYSNDQGNHVTRVPSSGFCRISSGNYGVWTVGCNGTLWRYNAGIWTKTLASGMGDVAAHGFQGTIDLAGLNGTIWSTYDGGKSFYRDTTASGFASVANYVNAGQLYYQTWAVGYNGTLWLQGGAIVH